MVAWSDSILIMTGLTGLTVPETLDQRQDSADCPIQCLCF